MKDHEIAELVNELTIAAREAKDAQCLREVIAGKITEPLHLLTFERDDLREVIAIVLKREEKLIEALKLYADPETWGKDDWGIKAVNNKEYGNPGEIARKVILENEK